MAYFSQTGNTEAIAGQIAEHTGGELCQVHCIERSQRMIELLDSSIELLRNKHKNGEIYYWLLYKPEWEGFLETLSTGQQEKAEEMKEYPEDFASAQENCAYMQGYVDCIQVLYHMGLLKENEGLRWVGICGRNLRDSDTSRVGDDFHAQNPLIGHLR